jgi:hypothetical protein
MILMVVPVLGMLDFFLIGKRREYLAVLFRKPIPDMRDHPWFVLRKKKSMV